MAGEVVQDAEPQTLHQAMALAREAGAPYLAGGCEFALARRRGLTIPGDLIRLDRIPELARLEAHPKKWLLIGATVKLCQIANHLWIAKRWAALHEAVEQIRPPQIRNMGTLVGNICATGGHNDLRTALLALDAQVRIVGPVAARELSMEDFCLEGGRTALAAAELVREVYVAPPSPDAGGASCKVERPQDGEDRTTEEPAQTVNVSSYVALDAPGHTIVAATIAVGGTGMRPRRARSAEHMLGGSPATRRAFAAAAAHAAEEVTGSSDRAAGLQDYDIVRALTLDALELANSRARSRHDPFEDSRDLI